MKGGDNMSRFDKKAAWYLTTAICCLFWGIYVLTNIATVSEYWINALGLI